MAGIQTDTDTVFSFYMGNYFRQFLKCTAHFRPFSRHRFEKHRGIQIFLIHSIIHHIRNERNSDICPLFQMGAGVEIIKTPWQTGHLRQIFSDGGPRKFPDICFRRCAVHGIGTMAKYLSEIMSVHPFFQLYRIFFRQRFCCPTPGIAGKELECIRPEFCRRLRHTVKSFCNR